MSYNTSVRLVNGRYEYDIKDVEGDLIVYGRREIKRSRNRSEFEPVPKKDERSVRAFLRGYDARNRFSGNVRVVFSKSKLED